MSALLWFVIGLSVGACLGFVVFAALQMSRKADRNAVLIDEEMDEAERIAASVLRKLSASSQRVF